MYASEALSKCLDNARGNIIKLIAEEVTESPFIPSNVSCYNNVILYCTGFGAMGYMELSSGVSNTLIPSMLGLKVSHQVKDTVSSRQLWDIKRQS